MQGSKTSAATSLKLYVHAIITFHETSKAFPLDPL